MGGCLCLRAQGVFGSVWWVGCEWNPCAQAQGAGAISVESGVGAPERGGGARDLVGGSRLPGWGESSVL